MKHLLQLLISSFFLGLFGIVKVPAQSTFNVIIKDTIYDHQIYDALELSSGNFIILDVTGLSPTTTCSRVSKLKSTGEVIIQKNFSYEGISSTLNSVSRISDNEIVFCGAVNTPELNQLWFCVTDTSLNIISEKTFSLSGNNLFLGKVKTGSNNDLICFGTVEDTTLYRSHHFFMYKLSLNLDSLQFKIFMERWGYGLDLIERNDQMGYYAVVLGVNPVGGPGNLLSINNSLNICKMVNIAHDITNLGSITYTDKTHLIVTGEIDLTNNHERDIGSVLYDTSFNVLHFAAFGKSDTIDCPGLLKNIELSTVNSIALVGTTNFDFSSMLAMQDSWYSLYNIDTTLGLNWQKFYGGDGYYTLYGVLATKDEGYLLYGTFWDYHHTQNYIRYLSIIKVNKDGLILSSSNDRSSIPYDVVVFPNPGSDLLYVETQLRNSIFILYDLTGNEVLNQKLFPGCNHFTVQNVKPGFYLYKVLLNSHVRECGKWIKK